MSNYPVTLNGLFNGPRFFFVSISLSICFKLSISLLILFGSLNVGADALVFEPDDNTDVISNLDELSQGTLLFRQNKQLFT